MWTEMTTGMQKGAGTLEHHGYTFPVSLDFPQSHCPPLSASRVAWVLGGGRAWKEHWGQSPRKQRSGRQILPSRELAGPAH